MNLNVDNWFPESDKLIQMIKQYPIIYRDDGPKTCKEYKLAVNTAWDEIETALGIPKKSCMQLWKNIKLKYSKFKILLNSEKISKEVIELNKEKSHFFNGTLSFLDPYISEITEPAIPCHIHKQVSKIFDVKDSKSKKTGTLVTHDQIIRVIRKRRKEKDFDNTDLQHLEGLVTNVIKHKLSKLFPLDITESDSDSQASNKEINLGLQSELITEKHIKKEETETEVDDKIYNTDGDIIPSINMNNEIGGCGKPSRISDINMKKFFIELGEVMSIELSNQKQILLKQRINGLLRNISKEELT